MHRLAAALLAAVFVLSACGGTSPSASSAPSGASAAHSGAQRAAVAGNEIQFTPPAEGAALATMETSEGAVKFVLYPEYAPLAVENFVTLAQSGYYDGTLFHRIDAGFVIQGGDPTGTGFGGESIWGHAFLTERSNYLHHYAGALCMAAAQEGENTHQSQFYVVAAPPGGLGETTLEQLRSGGWRAAAVDTYAQAGGIPYLDNTDTVFGQVVEGMDVVDAIAATPLTDEGAPRRQITVNRVVIQNWPPQGRASQPAAESFVPALPPEDMSWPEASGGEEEGETPLA